MSFLNQLKSQASALQGQQQSRQAALAENTQRAEQACKTVQYYLNELAQQLNVLAPPGPKLTLDGKTPWPAMKLMNFRVDTRRKMLRDKEVTDYIAMGWQILPQMGAPVGGSVTVNFPPDWERVEKRLALGSVKHERKEVRHPEKNTLQAFRYEYLTESRGYITVTPNHDEGQIGFRLANVTGFEVQNVSRAATEIQTDVLDELAKLLVGQPNRFV